MDFKFLLMQAYEMFTLLKIDEVNLTAEFHKGVNSPLIQHFVAEIFGF